MEVRAFIDVWDPYVTLLACCLFVLFLILLLQPRYPAGFPPGPWGWPVVGNLLQVGGGDGLYANLLNFRATYGDVFRVRLGQQTVVFIFGHKNIRDVLQNDQKPVSERPNWLYIPQNVLQQKGIVWSNGEANARSRRFIYDAFGTESIFGNIEACIQRECQRVISLLQANEQPENLSQVLLDAELTTIWTLITGERQDPSSETYQRIQGLLKDRNSGVTISTPQNFFSWWTILFKRKVNATLETQQRLVDCLDDVMTRREAAMDPNKPQGLMDLYLTQIKEGKLTDAEKYDMYMTMLDMSVASYKSLEVIIQWTLLNMAKNMDIQTKCRDELQKIVQGRDVEIRDRDDTPYMRSTLLESLRRDSHVPLSLMYFNNEEIKVNGFDIPKHTLITFVYHSMKNDETLWTCPAELRPERFIEDPRLAEPPNYTVFGIGDRQCPGRKLSDMFQYIIMCNILRNFEVTDVSGNDKMDSYFERTLRPKELKLRFRKLA